jgi:hypothetical protein
MSEDIASNLHDIRERIAAAIARRGPGPDVRLIGVSKKQPLSKLEAARAAGLEDFGENYAQELAEKQAAWPADKPVRWHYIGALQSNKVRLLVGKVALIHTVDRVELIREIDKRAASAGVVQEFLIEVNLGGEEQKAGAAPGELAPLLELCAEAPHARCIGLMIIPPADEPEATRPYFRQLRALRDELHAAYPHVNLRELSMGMSSDFEVAIEEGATLVRVGTAIFGARA